MVRIVFSILALSVAGCGTVGGFANGTGELFDGLASDARGVGSVFRR